MQPLLNKNPVYIDFQDYDTKQYVCDGVYVKLTHDVDYGDVIIIDNRNATRRDTVIKRTMGLGGDYVSIVKVDSEWQWTGEYRFMRVKKNSPTVEILEEDYILDYDEWSEDPEIEVDNGEYSVYYDNDFFKTCHATGMERKTFKVSLNGGKSMSDVTFFKVPENHVFYMGDNRAHSNDSRHMPGTMPLEKVVGKVVEIVPKGTPYPGNKAWWLNRAVGFINVLWKETLRFFGANVGL